MHRLLFANLIAMLLMIPISSAVAQNIQNSPIPVFREVSSGIYRGARPTAEGLRFLSDIGVKTILYLDNDSKQMAWEIKEAEKLGIKVITTPMSGFWKPKTKQVNQSLSILADRNNHPIFVHCQYGQDRTGLITGLFRVEYQGWDPEDAYNEMLDVGFHQSLIFLDLYYSKRTGYRPPPVTQDPIYQEFYRY